MSNIDSTEKPPKEHTEKGTYNIREGKCER